MSVSERLYKNLVVKGKAMTAKQIASQFNVANPYDLIYELRNDGVKIALQSVTDSKGRTTRKYRYVG